MELTDAMRTTGTCRYFRPDPVPDEVLRARVRRRPLRPAGRQPPARALDRRPRRGHQAGARRPLPAAVEGLPRRHRRRRGPHRRAAADRGRTPTTSPSTSPRSPRSSSPARSWTGCTPPTPSWGGCPSSAAGRSTRRCRTSASRCATRASAPPSPRCCACPSPPCASCSPSPTATSRPRTSPSATRQAVPDEAHPVPGRGDRLRRGVRPADVRRGVRMLADHHRARIGRATLGDQLRRHARTQPRHASPSSSYAPRALPRPPTASSTRRANRYAHLLLARGVGRGDVVAVMARNSVEVDRALLRRAEDRRRVHRASTSCSASGRSPSSSTTPQPAAVLAAPEFAGAR